MSSFSKTVLKNRLLIFVIAMGLGDFIGYHANRATVSYLYEFYYFNKDAHAIIGLIVNIAIIVLSCYLFIKYLIMPAEKKIKDELKEKFN